MGDDLDRIRRILYPIVESLGLTVWDIEFHKQGPKWLLRIYIEREASGVTLDDCEAVSRDLGAALDVEDLIDHPYTLEVSSPGLNRSLTKPEHFLRFIGNDIKVKTFQQIDGQKVFRGRLVSLDGEIVRMELENADVIDIPLSRIAKASLEIQV